MNQSEREQAKCAHTAREAIKDLVQDLAARLQTLPAPAIHLVCHFIHGPATPTLNTKPQERKLI